MAANAAITTRFGFHLEYVDAEDHLLRERRVAPAEFGRAADHTRFEAFRRGLIDEYQPLRNGAHVTPLFQSLDAASPRADGFSVTVPLTGGREYTCEFDIAYFRSTAKRVRAELLREGTLPSGQALHYRLNAFLDDEIPVEPANKLALSLEPPTGSLAVGSQCRRDFGPVEAWDEPCSSDLPVLMDRGVLEEIVDEARAAPEHEVAGFLLGRVNRDESNRDVFLAVTGLASASGTTESSATSVTFTPASFARVRSIIKLRSAGEIICGWFHSHPFRLCAECPLPTPPECIAKVLFYSQDDIHLMETTFDQPFMVGLLAAVEPRIEQAVGHLPVKLYGWHSGQINERGFEVVEAAAHSFAKT